MVFSSHHLYLDPPPNWHHQQQVILYNEGGNEITAASNNSLQQQQPPFQQPSAAVGGGSRTIRPGSMTDRARMAKVPLPETPLKCPRCESTNTKFCYFNNYSLTQPRHFCKTCRRYWTRGGALRNVPVGGGCRRATKRSSKKRSKSSDPPAVSGSAANGIIIATSSADHQAGGLGNNLSSDDQMMMPFYPHGTGNDQFGDHLYIGGGSSYTGAPPADPHLARLFQSGLMSSLPTATGAAADQQYWSKVAEETSATTTLTQMHHPSSFPFMANFSNQQQEYNSPLPPPGLIHQFDHHHRGGRSGTMHSDVATQFGNNVKMEDENNKCLRRSVDLHQAQAAGATSNSNNHNNWAGSGTGNTWTDLFGLFPSNPSSTGHNGL